MRKLVLALVAALLLAAAPAAQAAATKLTITGAGFGHGIGMSQYGTYGYSLHLKTYDYILGHYYSGTTLGALDANPEVRVLLQGSRKSISFSGGLNAGDQKLDPAQTYTVRRSAAGLDLRDATGKSVGTVAGTLRVDAPVGQAAAPERHLGARRARRPVPRLAAHQRLGLRPRRRQRARPRGLRARRGQRREPVGVADRGAQGPGRGRAHVRDHLPRRRRASSTSTPTRARRSIAASPPRRPTPTRPCRPPPGQVVTFGGQPVTTYFFSTSGGETEDVENSFVGSQPKPWLKAVDDPFDSVSPKHRWGPFRFTAAQVQRKLHRYLQGRFKRIKVLQRGVSPRVVRAQVVGTGGVTNVTGPQLRSAFGLFDTWAFFTSVTSKASKPKPKKKPAATPATPATRPAASRRSRARPPRTRRASRARSRPARVGRWVRVERREGTRWVAATDARVLRGGRYSVAVPGPGVYRVVYGQAVGPSVRVS